METFLIVGLGNPGLRYAGTRHNAGYRAVERLAERIGMAVTGRHFHALTGDKVIDGRKLILMKPETYMNLSGDAVRAASDYFCIDPAHIIVISDDTALGVGHLRIRLRGSAGGHNGLKDIIDKTGSDEFTRIRLGIGAKDKEMDLKDYVLSRFTADEAPIMDRVYDAAAEAVLFLIDEGPDAAMSRFNGLDLSEDPDV